jgi:phosphoribosyl 1,2-cyclic phosphodiesterase
LSLQIASLNSGSNGNCYYVGNSTTAVLIDVGISCREAEIRMKQIGLDIKKVKAIFVTHEHGDHIKGVSVLSNKYAIPVYITPATATKIKLIKHLSKPFTANVSIAVDELLVTPFSKKHDAADPHSFIVNYNHITVGIFTDIGIVCNNLIHYFKQCNAAFLESNYDEEMLDKGNYPLLLKNRIRGGEGHLSNSQAVHLFINHRSNALSHLLLSHLSKENNTPQIATQLFQTHSTNTKIIVASRYEASEVYEINSLNTTVENTVKQFVKPQQMQLF